MNESADKKDTVVNAQTTSTPEPTRKNSKHGGANRLVIVAIVGVFAIGIVALLSWILFFHSGSSGAGRPGPTPRTTSTDHTPSPTTAESTVTASPDVIQRAGIKIEPVGGQIAIETSATASTT